MNLFTASLNSGSNGNCYYIGNEEDAVLVDAGLSSRETERRLARLGLSIHKVRAVFITHEHTDHMRGMEGLAKKHAIPIHISTDTYGKCRARLDPQLVIPIIPHESVRAGSLSVLAFPKQHDGVDPHSFTVSYQGITIGIFTDIGIGCETVALHLSRCQAAFLEANYDEVMLETGRYPAFLKQRIRGGKGHLSNIQALNLFTQYRSPRLQLLVLSHLSAMNNDIRLVQDLFTPHANGTRIAIASRHQETEVYHITE